MTGIPVENENQSRDNEISFRNIFCRKVLKPLYPDVHVNNNPVNSTSVHKHLGMMQYSKLSFEEHPKSLLAKVRKTIALICKFWLHLPINLFVKNL